jgi:putative membrane protein insertion efficiency factor
VTPLARLLSVPVIVYRWTLSPVLGNNCRFEPSCSRYALDALRLHGGLKGSLLAAWRILRCNPWGGMGYDPVPEPDRQGHRGHACGPGCRHGR